MAIGIAIGLLIWAAIVITAAATLTKREQLNYPGLLLLCTVLLVIGGASGFLIEKAVS